MSVAEAGLALILDSVHAALRRGDYDALPALTEAMEAAADGIALADADEALALRGKFERNAACLMATARGLRAARRRLAEIARAQTGLATYAASGEVTRIGGPDGRLTQRL